MKKKTLRRIALLGVCLLAVLAFSGCHKPQKQAQANKSYPAQTVIEKSGHMTINSAKIDQTTVDGGKESHLSAIYLVNNKSRLAKMDFKRGRDHINYWYESNRMYAKTPQMRKWVTAKVKDQNQQALNQAQSVTSLRTIWARLAQKSPKLISYNKNGNNTHVALANTEKNRKAIEKILNAGKNSASRRRLSYVYMSQDINNLNVPTKIVMNIKGTANGHAIEESQTVNEINQHNDLKIPKSIKRHAIKQKMSE